VWAPTPFDYKFYEDNDLLDKIEDGFYDDYDPFDSFDIFTKLKHLGAIECLQSLVDHAGGDF